MTRSKEIIFRLGSPLTTLLSFSFLRNLSGRKLLVPVYHAVSDMPAPHLKYLYRVKSPGEFEADLDTLLRHYKPLTIHELIGLAAGGKQPGRPSFHITFDDGLREFYEVAAPILERKGIPATCFLNNHFINNKKMLFRMKASLLIDHLHYSAPGSKAWVAFHDWVQKHGYGRTYYRKLLLGMKLEDLAGIEDLAGKMGIDFQKWQSITKPYMNSEQIRELIGKGFTFGAHGTEHTDFRALSIDAQLEELERSVEGLTADLGLDYRVFSFRFTDFGISQEFFDRVREKQLCQLSFGCAGIKEDAVHVNLQRMPVEEYPSPLIRALKKEYLYHFLLRMSGRAKIKRS